MSTVPLKRAKTLKRYLFVFSQTHVAFRTAEFAAICDLFGIPFERKSLEDNSTHLHVLEYESDDPVKQILSRSTRVRAAYEILEEGVNLDELESRLRAKPELFKQFDGPEHSWRFRFRPQGKKPGNDVFNELRERITSVMANTSAPVDLVSPVHEFNLIVDFMKESEHSYICRTVGEGQLLLKTTYNLKERKYIGNSTMDPELAFIQANLVQARPASLILDPFCGTGGLLIPAAHFGATVIGTEINYQVARGEGKSSRQGETWLAKDQTVFNNFVQYGLTKQYGDVIVGDASRHGLWRQAMQFDAIIADPPYGIREKSSKVGVKKDKDGNVYPQQPHDNHYPEKAKYSLNQAFIDIMDLASTKLVVGGRVAFWFPVSRDTYNENVLPRHEALQLVDNCEQMLTQRGSRLLLVYKKLREPIAGEVAYIREDPYANGTFREIMFVQGRAAATATNSKPGPSGDAPTPTV